MAKNFWDDVKAPPTWSQLAGNPAFASLSVQEREAAKQQYFKDFVAPIAKRNGDPIEYAWSVFSEGADAITTKLHSPTLDNPPVPDAVRAQNAAEAKARAQAEEARLAELAAGTGFVGKVKGNVATLGQGANQQIFGLLPFVMEQFGGQMGGLLASSAEKEAALAKMHPETQAYLRNKGADKPGFHQKNVDVLRDFVDPLTTKATALIRKDMADRNQALEDFKPLAWREGNQQFGQEWEQADGVLDHLGVLASHPNAVYQEVLKQAAGIGMTGLLGRAVMARSAAQGGNAMGKLKAVNIGMTGAQGGADAASGAYDSVMQLPEETLKQSPLYQQYAKQYDADTARQMVATQAAQKAGFVGAGLGMAAGRIGANVEAGMMGRMMGVKGAESLTLAQAARQIPGKVGIEMLEEGADEAGNQLSANYGVRETADANQSLSDGVGKSAIMGAALGGVMGVGINAADLRSAGKRHTAANTPQTGDLKQDLDAIIAAPVTPLGADPTLVNQAQLLGDLTGEVGMPTQAENAKLLRMAGAEEEAAPSMAGNGLLARALAGQVPVGAAHGFGQESKLAEAQRAELAGELKRAEMLRNAPDYGFAEYDQTPGADALDFNAWKQQEAADKAMAGAARIEQIDNQVLADQIAEHREARSQFDVPTPVIARKRTDGAAIDRSSLSQVLGLDLSKISPGMNTSPQSVQNSPGNMQVDAEVNLANTQQKMASSGESNKISEQTGEEAQQVAAKPFTPRTFPKLKPDSSKHSALQLIALSGGIKPDSILADDLRSALGIEKGKNMRVPGTARFLFSPNAKMSVDDAAQRLWEYGLIPEHDAMDMLGRLHDQGDFYGADYHARQAAMDEARLASAAEKDQDQQAEQVQAVAGFDVAMDAAALEDDEFNDLAAVEQAEYLQHLARITQADIDALQADYYAEVGASLTNAPFDELIAFTEEKLDAPQNHQPESARSGSQDHRESHSTEAAKGTGATAQAGGFQLEGLTESQARAEASAREREAQAQRQREAAPAADDFILTGSDRAADVAAAHGAQDLFSAPVVKENLTTDPVADLRQRALQQPKTDAQPEVKDLASDGTYKAWKRAVKNLGKVNGWDLFHDTLDGSRFVLMTPYSSAGFDTEQEARAWAAENKANPRGYFKSADSPSPQSKPDQFSAPAVVKENLITEQKDRITPESAGNMRAGDVIRDDQGNEYLALGARHKWLDAAPIVDGKPQVSSDTSVRFHLDPETASEYPWRKHDSVYATGRNLYEKNQDPKPQPNAKISISNDKIEDFGAKLEGAAKDRLRVYKTKLENAADLDATEAPLSKLWPEPNYQALLDDGVDPYVVAFVRAARDEVPAKPRKGWKVKGWADKVAALRSFAFDMLEGGVKAEDVRKQMHIHQHGVLRDVIGRIDLYQRVGHDYSLSGVTLSKGEYGIYDGVKFDPPKVIWSVEGDSKTAFGNMGRNMGSGDTREEAIEAFAAKYAEFAASLKPARSGETKFEIYRRRSAPNVWIVGKKVGKDYIDLETFKTSGEAEARIAQGREALEKKLEAARAIPSERRAVNVPRLGEDYRFGADVSVDQFQDEFGFRGGQFGNSMPQKERTANLNQSYDALMDLAAIIGIPPKALSLNGELGLAFGARGKGGKGAAAAHYEPDTTGKVTDDTVVINLTRENGPGSLAHEWFHAIDNYFARMRGEKEGALTEKPHYRGEGVRPEMVAAFKGVMDAINASGMPKRSAPLDERKGRPYWATNHEMAGRAFEAYVIDKLQSQEKSNDYLANIVSKEYWDAQEALMRMDFTNTDQPGADSTYPYPTESEMPAISKAFDQFFATIKHEETANGNVRLFEPKAGYNESPQQWDESYGVQEAEGGNPDGEQQAARAFDVDAPSAIPGAPEVSLIQVGKQKAPRVIRSASEAASATRYLSQFAQERLVALVTDAKGVPLAIIHHTTGKTNSAQVEFGVLAGAITSINGAANVWISHNHPSGEAALSDSDRAVFDRIKDLMDGSGVTAQGILAVTPKIFSADGAQKADNWYIKDLPARGKTIEVVERAFVVQPKARLGVTSPSAAMRMISAYSAGKTGVLLMDTQHKPTAFIPLTGEQMGKLRDGSLGDVLRAIHKTGAKSALGVVNSREEKLQWLNLASMLDKAEITVLDVFTRKGDELESAAQAGDRIVGGDKFYSAPSNPTRPFRAPEVRNADGKLLAPNGQPSKLNEHQWHQVRSPEFKAWFGDWENDPANASKVVDANGEPLVVYHGTRRAFDEFVPSKPRGAIGNPSGIYFSPDKSAALEYAQDVDGAMDDRSRVVEAYIKIAGAADGVVKDSKYSGIEYIVFNPENVKSATGNAGTFDGSNPSILASDGNQQQTGSTVSEVRAAMVAAFGARRVEGMERTGAVKIVQSERDVPGAAEPILSDDGYEDPSAQGFYDPVSNTAYLVADGLAPNEVRSTMLHEGVHWLEHNRPELMARVRTHFTQQMDAAMRFDDREGAISKWFRTAWRRVPPGTPHKHVLSEIMAYSVTNYVTDQESAPVSMRKWLGDFVAGIRVALIRMGWNPKEITPADMAALARYAVRKMGKTESLADKMVNLVDRGEKQWGKIPDAEGMASQGNDWLNIFDDANVEEINGDILPVEQDEQTRRDAKHEQRDPDAVGFLSPFKARGAFTYTGEESRLLERVRRASTLAADQLGGEVENTRRSDAAVGPFSGYTISAEVTDPDSFNPNGTLQILVYGKEQNNAGLTDEPALTFVVTPDGELTVNGPTGTTFDEFKKRGWATEAVGKNGEKQIGWTALVSPKTEDGALPTSELIPLLADVHARAKIWKGNPDKVGLHWTRQTGATGGLFGRETAVFFSRPTTAENIQTDEETKNPGQVAGASASEGIGLKDQGWLDRQVAKVQNNLNRAREIQDKLGLAEWAGFYGAAERMPGRTASRLEDLQNRILKPIAQELAAIKRTPEQLSTLLHAMHAKERNAQVASVNPSMPDGGSGMSNAEADAILKSYKDDAQLHALADKLRAVTRRTLDAKLAYGLIDQATHDRLTQHYQYYVPLKGDQDSKRTGSGYSVGRGDQRAMGHNRRDEMILENVAMDAERAIAQGEKNLALQQFLMMARQFKDSKLWTIGEIPKSRSLVEDNSYAVHYSGAEVATFDTLSEAKAFIERDGRKYKRTEQSYEIVTERGEKVREFALPLQDNEVRLFVAGREVRIQIHDAVLAEQMRMLNVEQLNAFLEMSGAMNRWFATVYTGKNPDFILKNMARDGITGTFNNIGNMGIGGAAKAWGNYKQAIKALYHFARTGEAPDTEAGRYLAEYRQHGGKTGASHISDLEAHKNNLLREYEDAKGAGAFAEEGRVGKAAWVATRKTIGALADVVDAANVVTENALRLSTFMAARKMGKSAEQAASLAKNVTVNFDRKGSATPTLGALYLFLNPAVQGTANAYKTLTRSEYKEQAWAALGALAGAGVFFAAMGMDDDEDKWLGESFSQRTRNIIVRVGDKAVRIPMSQELAPIYAFGVAIAEMAYGQKPGDSAIRLASSALDAWFPRNVWDPDSDNHAATLGLALIPTAISPLAETALNRDGLGRKIVPKYDRDEGAPDNRFMNRNTRGTLYDKAAQGLAAAGEAMGAGRYEDGLSKVSPESLRHVFRAYAGGLGAFLVDTGMVSAKLATGEAIKTDDVPIVKSWARTDTRDRGRFYALKDEAADAAKQLSEARKKGDGDEMRRLYDTKRDLLQMHRLMSSQAKALRLLRDAADLAMQDESLNAEQKGKRLEALARQEAVLYRDTFAAIRGQD